MLHSDPAGWSGVRGRLETGEGVRNHVELVQETIGLDSRERTAALKLRF